MNGSSEVMITPSLKGNFFTHDEPLSALHDLRMQRIVGGQEVIDLSMINPDIPPDRRLVDHLVASSLKSSNHRYAVSRGIKKLRESFCLLYERAFGVGLDSNSEVCVTAGSKDALYCALRTALSPGDSVLVGAPTYPTYLSAINLLGMQLTTFEVNESERSMIAEIKAKLLGGQHRMLILNFPHNPTGTVVSREFMQEVAAICASCGVFLINDFTYGEMVYGGAGVSALSERAEGLRSVEAYSLSKAYSIPGWRVGALLGDAEWIARVARLKSNLDYGTFLPIQLAASFALANLPDLAAETAAVYERRAAVMHAAISALGWEASMPKAGASLWVKPANCSDSLTFACSLLERCGIMALPGMAFGAEYSDKLRFALVQSEERIREAARIMGSLA